MHSALVLFDCVFTFVSAVFFNFSSKEKNILSAVCSEYSGRLFHKTGAEYIFEILRGELRDGRLRVIGKKTE